MNSNTSHKESLFITRLKNSDEQAFLAIYNDYSGVLWTFLQRFHLEKSDIEDVIQETFVKLWERRKQLDEDLSLKSYLITIAKNDIYNKVKHQIVQRKHQEHATYYADRESNVSTSDLSEVLDRILLTLPERRREVFEMSRIKGYSNREIAETLGISKSTVENHINHSSNYVKKILRNLGFIFIYWLFH